MSYTVLARKWRPQTFKEVVGQRHVVKTLQNALSSKRLAHAYLFAGVRGVGKTTMARLLAKSLNCEKGITSEICNECLSCKEITNGSSIDVIEIDGASNTGVDDVREINDNVRYLPSRSRYKVYIIDEVHMLSTSAFNALLKTLEEPPPHVVFIFATTEPHKIPLTVLSRCQRFDFRRLSTDNVKTQLNLIAVEEGIKASDEALSLIAREAEGSMRDAQSLMDQIVSYSGSEFGREDIIDLLGLIDRELLLETLQYLINRDAEGVLTVIEKAYNLGYDEKRLCQNLLELFRDLTILKTVKEPERFVDLTLQEVQGLKDLLERVGIEELQLFFNYLSKGLEEISRSSYPRIVLEMVFLKIVGSPPLRSLTDILKRLANLEKNGDERLPPVAGHKEGDMKGDTTWNGFLKFVMKEKPPLGSQLNSVQILFRDDKKIVLGVKKFSDYLMDMDVKENLERLYNNFFGKPLKVEIEELSKERMEKASFGASVEEEMESKEGVKEGASKDSFIRDMAEIFGRNIREVSKETV